MKEERLFRTGFLPGLRKARLLYVGNSSLEGAFRQKIDKSCGSHCQDSSGHRVSQIPDFEGVFIREMHF